MKKIIISSLLFLLILACSQVSFASTVDPYTSLEISNGEATLYYMTLFDDACEKYRNELTLAEIYAAIDVYDAIGQLNFDESDESLRKHLLSITGADDLKLLLTGFFDAHDFTYHSDNTVVNRIGEILLSIGLDVTDYHISVVRNRHDLPLISQDGDTWYCKLGKETGNEQYPYEEIVIVLCDEDYHVFALMINNIFFDQN